VNLNDAPDTAPALTRRSRRPLARTTGGRMILPGAC